MPLRCAAGEPTVEWQVNMPLSYMGERVPVARIVEEIEAVDGVLSHGILLDAVHAALVTTEQGPQTLTAAP